MGCLFSYINSNKLETKQLVNLETNQTVKLETNQLVNLNKSISKLRNK